MSLFANHFYHGIVRKTIIAFGTLFEGLTIVYKDTDSKKVKQIKVPLQYAPKEKWLRRLTEDPDMTKNVATDLPRMSFEITSYKYDPARKLGSVENYITAQLNGKSVKLYTPVPYELGITMYAYTKTQEDALQILEQITPYFSPAMTVDVMMIPELKVTQKIPFTLIDPFQFTAKINMYGPIVEGKPIKRAIVDSSANPYFNETDDQTYRAEVNPFSANKYDDYTIDEFTVNG
jgi:hypothetical protein